MRYEFVKIPPKLTRRGGGNGLPPLKPPMPPTPPFLSLLIGTLNISITQTIFLLFKHINMTIIIN